MTSLCWGFGSASVFCPVLLCVFSALGLRLAPCGFGSLRPRGVGHLLARVTPASACWLGFLLGAVRGHGFPVPSFSGGCVASQVVGKGLRLLGSQLFSAVAWVGIDTYGAVGWQLSCPLKNVRC